MNILDKKYDVLTDNISKFDFLEKCISEDVTFSLSDYKKVFLDHKEIAYFFIDEYHFQDLSDDLNDAKWQVCLNFILPHLKNAEDTEWLSFLDFFKKTNYTEFLDFLQKHKLQAFSDSVQLIILNFLEINFLDLNQINLELLLNEFFKAKNTVILNRFVALSILYKIDFEKYDSIFKKFISKNTENEFLLKRFQFKINTYPVEIQNFIQES